MGEVVKFRAVHCSGGGADSLIVRECLPAN